MFVYALLLVHLPRLITTGLVSFRRHAADISAALGAGAWSRAGAAVLHIALLVLPTVGATYVLARTAKRIGVAAWGASARRPALRLGFVTGVAAVPAIAIVSLWPDEDYRPIGPDERGTLLEATRTVARSAAEDSPARGTPAPAEPSATPGGSAPPEGSASPDEPDDSSEESQATSAPAVAGSGPTPTPTGTPQPTSAPTPVQ